MATVRDYDERERKRKKAATSQPPTIETTTVSYTVTLTFDLVVEILSKLPVNSLMQLRCVCKSWNSLISDPKFAKKHLSWSRTQLNRHHLLILHWNLISEGFLLRDTQLSSFFNSTSTSIPDTPLSYPLKNRDGSNKIIGSCDGILCFSVGRFDNPSVMVWNPSIQKFKILPHLEYQPQLNTTIYGFGYDFLTDTYKVVAVCCYNCFKRDCEIKVKLLALGKNAWKTVEGFPSSLRGGIALSESGKFVSGAINWLVRVHTDSSSSWVIFSLDLGKEYFQEFLPPAPDYGVVCDLTLGVLRDCLCILSHMNTLVIQFWLMKDYGNKDSWTKLFVIPYKELGFQKPISAYPLCISEDDQLMLDFIVELAVYNSKDDKKLKRPKLRPAFNWDWFDKHVYIESLISPLC